MASEAEGAAGAGARAWTPDRASARCLKCGTAFSLLVRRHHCRACGLLLCGACTAWRSEHIPEYKGRFVRCCEKCHEAIRTRRERRSPGKAARQGPKEEAASKGATGPAAAGSPFAASPASSTPASAPASSSAPASAASVTTPQPVPAFVLSTSPVPADQADDASTQPSALPHEAQAEQTQTQTQAQQTQLKQSSPDPTCLSSRQLVDKLNREAAKVMEIPARTGFEGGASAGPQPAAAPDRGENLLGALNAIAEDKERLVPPARSAQAPAPRAAAPLEPLPVARREQYPSWQSRALRLVIVALALLLARRAWARS
jgi:hypothetical protein